MSNEGRNPKGIANGKKRYKYHHPQFCRVLGYASCTHRDLLQEWENEKMERDEAEKEREREIREDTQSPKYRYANDTMDKVKCVS